MCIIFLEKKLKIIEESNNRLEKFWGNVKNKPSIIISSDEDKLNGKILPKTLIPIWFDEGVATQNDYREIYNETAWLKATDNGKSFSEVYCDK